MNNQEEKKEQSSVIPGFYKLSMDARIKNLKNIVNLTDVELETLTKKGMTLEEGDRLVENVVGFMKIPIGIATNFLINGKDYLIPMATEESSVIAAASNAAKIARKNRGFTATSTDPIMIGQIQFFPKDRNDNLHSTRKMILQYKDEILTRANSRDPMLVKLGGGAKDIEVRIIKGRMGGMLIIHLLIDTRDAMGANAVNTMCEYVAPYIEEITGGKTFLKIITNLADRRIARAEVTINKDDIGGEDVVNQILIAYEFAYSDLYRASTHNKGVMNGITAVALATGNDTRAIEAGVHSYAAISGKYKPITSWEKDPDGNLYGKIEVPIAAGIIGGSVSANPIAQISLKILGVKTAKELSEVMAAVGLAQNFAAIRALATEGIQKGHMRLHAKNIAQTAGAKGKDIELIAQKMIEEGSINFQKALELLKKKELRKSGEIEKTRKRKLKKNKGEGYQENI